MERPPPIVASSKVIAFATVDKSVIRVRDDLLYVGGKPLGLVPKLTICIYPHESEYHLFFCDDEWNVLGCSTHDSVETAKRRAEKEYRGLMARWQLFHHEDEAAVDRHCLEPLCSFCGRSFREFKRMIDRKNARICEDCVRDLAGSLDNEC